MHRSPRQSDPLNASTNGAGTALGDQMDALYRRARGTTAQTPLG